MLRDIEEVYIHIRKKKEKKKDHPYEELLLILWMRRQSATHIYIYSDVLYTYTLQHITVVPPTCGKICHLILQTPAGEFKHIIKDNSKIYELSKL